MSAGVFLFDKNQELIKSIHANDLLDNTQVQNLKGQITGTCTAIYDEEIENAVYFGVKETSTKFWMHKIRKVTKGAGDITFDGIYIFFDDLKGKLIRDIRPHNVKANLVLDRILEGTGWKVQSINVTKIASAHYYHVSALNAFYDAVNTWDFEFTFEMHFNDGQITEKVINIYDKISKDNGRWFEYGDKLVDVVAETTTDNLFTAFVGRGKGIALEDEQGNATGGYSRKIKFDDIEYIKEIDGIKVNKPIGIDYIEIKEATAAFGYPDGTPLIGVVNFDNIEDKLELADATFKFAIENCKPRLQLRTTVRDGGEAELGETVTVVRSDMGIRYKTRVFRIKKDFLNLGASTFEFGDKIVQSAGEILKAQQVEERKRTGLIDSYIDALRIEITNSYFNDSAYNYDLKIDNKYNLPAGYYSFNKPIDENPTKVIYVGAGKMLIANSKKPDGSWKWTTAATGDGVVADSIVGTLGEFAKVNAHQISVDNNFEHTQLGEKVIIQNELYNNVKITPEKGLQVIDNKSQERVQLGNWAPNRYGLKLTDASGSKTVLDDLGLLQCWQIGQIDNADSDFPYRLHIYLPRETTTLYKAELRIYLDKFRAYSKALSTQPAQYETTNYQDTEYSTSDSGGGEYVSETTRKEREVLGTYHSPSQVDGQNVYRRVTAEQGYGNFIGYAEDYHVRSHSHSIDVQGHSHEVNFKIPSHRHDFKIPGHRHDVKISGHDHDIVYGIYEDSSNSANANIVINGIDRTQTLLNKASFSGNLESVDITQYLQSGKWNILEIKTNGRLRINAQVFMQALLSYGGY